MRIKTITAASTSALMVIVLTGVMGTMHSQNPADTEKPEQIQKKIARALAAGPDNVTKDATVAEPDGHGGLNILRQGTKPYSLLPETANYWRIIRQ